MITGADVAAGAVCPGSLVLPEMLVKAAANPGDVFPEVFGRGRRNLDNMPLHQLVEGAGWG